MLIVVRSETCIKGHRSSTCKHTDRPLFEIKKKGRPVTQCEHCRELRKTKQVHVKCMCATKEDGEGSSKRGSVKVPASAAFPSGLPEALEASVALQPLSDGSDSEHSGHASSAPCSCKDSGSCTCCTVRVPRPKRKTKLRERRGSAGDTSTPEVEPQITQPAGLVVNAHAGDYRPVLPRPMPSERQPSPRGPVHDPSLASAHASSSRHQLHHGQMFFSPYSRAYEYTHGPEMAETSSNTPSAFHDTLSSVHVPSPSHADTAAAMSDLPSWLPPLNVHAPEASAITSVLCGCGSSCLCPGCIEHRGQDADPNAACTDPHTCMSCLDCAMLSLPVTLPPDSSPTAYEDSQLQSVDEWLRQVAGMGAPTSQPLSPFSPGSNQSSDRIPSQSDHQFDPNMLQTYALWNNLQDGRPVHAAPEECCGGRCKCPAGMCACAADCCGCCQGCQCPDCEHEDQNRSLTFATSGERAPCCGGSHQHRHRHQHQYQRQPIMEPAPVASSMRASGFMGGHQQELVGDSMDWQATPDTWTTQSLSVPRTTLSRASSLSSQSSGGHSHITSSSLGPALQVPNSNGGAPSSRSCCSSR